MNLALSGGLASVPAVTQYLRSARSLGVNYEPLLVESGIDSNILKDNSRHISSRAMEKLLGLLIKASGDPYLGSTRQILLSQPLLAYLVIYQ